MTVPSEQSRIQYQTDGVSVSFPVPFRFIEAQHLRVTRQHGDVASTLTLGSDYTVSGANNPAGGTLTTLVAYPAGDALSIERIVPVTQETAYQRNDPFPERAHEQALDKLTMICQMLASILGLTPGSQNRALLLGAADMDGQGSYRTNGNRIQDVGDAVAMHDAINKKVLLDHLSGLAADGSGQFVVERLADPTDPANGAGMIGYTDEKTVSQALDNVISRLPDSNLNYPGIAAALNSGSSVMTLAGDTYTFDSALVVDSANLQEIRGNGDTVLDFSNSDTGLVIDSGLTPLPAPSSIDDAGGYRITFPNVSLINPGDVIVIWNPDNYSLNQYREYYRDGFMARVSTVNASTGVVTIYGGIPDFNRSTVLAYKLTNNRPLRISGVRIIPPAGGIGLHIKCRQRVLIDGTVVVDSGGYTGIEIERCFDVTVNAPLVAADYADAYPIVISNTQNYRINGITGNSVRHSIGLGGRSGAGSVPTRDGIISHCALENDATLGTGAADVHGNVVGLIYNNCIINSSAHIAGRDITYNNCVIHSRKSPADALCISGSEIAGGLYQIIDCVLDITGASVSNSFANIYLYSKYATHDLSLVIRGLTLRGQAQNWNQILVNFSPEATFDKKIFVDIRELTVLSGSLTRVFSATLGDVAPTSLPDAKISIDVAGVDAQEFAIWHPSLPDVAKFRITGERGRTTLLSVSGAHQSAPKIVNTKYYPRPPSVRVWSNSNFQGGGRVTYFGADAVENNRFALRASTLDAAWTSNFEFDVGYEVDLIEF